MAKQTAKQPKKQKAEQKPANRPAWLIWSGIPFLLLTLFYLIRSKPDVCSVIARKISAPYRELAARASEKVPFCLSEVLTVGAVLAVVIYIIIMIRAVIRSQTRFRTLFRRLAALVVAALWVLSLYCLCFGVEYMTPGFARENGLKTGGVTVQQLYEVTKLFAENASRLAPKMERGDFGEFIGDDEAYFRDSVYVYDGIVAELPALEGTWHRPKPMYFSKLFSAMGFTGLYFPFTGENCINMDFPASGRPFTVAHELAHSRRVIPEDQANFVGIAACVTSDMEVWEYSGWLAGYTYLSSALYGADRERWREIYDSLDDYVKIDLREENAYWDSFRSAVTTAAETAYDGYLKSNGVDSGIRSYGECVNLLVNYYGQ